MDSEKNETVESKPNPKKIRNLRDKMRAKKKEEEQVQKRRIKQTEYIVQQILITFYENFKFTIYLLLFISQMKFQIIFIQKIKIID